MSQHLSSLLPLLSGSFISFWFLVVWFCSSVPRTMYLSSRGSERACRCATPFLLTKIRVPTLILFRLMHPACSRLQAGCGGGQTQTLARSAGDAEPPDGSTKVKGSGSWLHALTSHSSPWLDSFSASNFIMCSSCFEPL